MTGAAMHVQRRGASFDFGMASTQGEAAKRRSDIATSAFLALVSSAANRRAHGLDLDSRERDAVQRAQQALRVGAEALRTGLRQLSGDATYEILTHAFVAYTSSRAVPSPRVTPPEEQEDQARSLEEVAGLLDGVLDEKHALPEKDGVVLVNLFETVSKDFLRRVARPGETVGGRSA